MQSSFFDHIATETGVAADQVQAALALLGEGATVPFIARYRKEATAGLDEVAITAIRDQAARMEEIEKRRAAILKSLERNGHLDDALEARIMAVNSLSRLEDIYLPYRPKKRTRAMAARERGLEPLAETIFGQNGIEPDQAAAEYVDPEKDVDSIDAALAGARDIIAERINEDEGARSALRELFASRAVLSSRVVNGKETEGAKYRDYFDWREPASKAPSHRILAIRRGEKEDVLNMSILPPEHEAIDILTARFVTSTGEDGQQVRLALLDAYKRLLARSMETEMRLATKERADAEAIRVFAQNLRQLLLAPPLGAKRVMGVDPGFRTGCKIVCLDRQGQLVHHETISPHTSDKLREKAAASAADLCERFGIEAVAVGNGTASRETEAFFRAALPEARPPVVIVNESGASVYSASEVAREEFPDLDLTYRGAVSIGRRLMDPLAELVKIDPKSIGVGQYQHDVDQGALRTALDDVVISCVNHVGVDVNRASVELLAYVSGLGPGLARNVVAFRNENGPFRTREALKNVSRLGPKAFEQAAGFLKITDGDNPLDASAVHPESYGIVRSMAGDLGCSVSELMADARLRRRVDIRRYATEQVGIPTLTDILKELDKPGRDPRKTFTPFSFSESVLDISDVEPGMKLPGIVTNVTDFGAFVDIGVHQDGLVHISKLADRFVSDPHTVVKVNQEVVVTVLDVDLTRKRISLSMITGTGQRGRDPSGKPASGKQTRSEPSARKKTRPEAGRREAKRPFHNPFHSAFGKSDNPKGDS